MECCKSCDYFGCWVIDCLAIRILSLSITGCHPWPTGSLIVEEGLLPLCRDVVSIFYSSSQQSGTNVGQSQPESNGNKLRQQSSRTGASLPNTVSFHTQDTPFQECLTFLQKMESVYYKPPLTGQLIICTYLHGFKYSYLILIICTELYGFKHSYSILIIYTQ